MSENRLGSRKRRGPSSQRGRLAAPTAGRAEARVGSPSRAAASATVGYISAALLGRTAARDRGRVATDRPIGFRRDADAVPGVVFSPARARGVAASASRAGQKRVIANARHVATRMAT